MIRRINKVLKTSNKEKHESSINESEVEILRSLQQELVRINEIINDTFRNDSNEKGTLVKKK